MQRGRIIICGSAAHLEKDSEEQKQAIRAAEALGLALAEAGFGIIVYSSQERFIEPYLVRGFLRKEELPNGAILCRLASGMKSTFDLGQHPPEVLKVAKAFSNDWDAPFYASFSDADGILLIGGGPTTRNSGLFAISMDLPICSVGAFGGAARQIVEELVHAREQLSLANDSILKMRQENWTNGLASELVEDLGERVDRHKAEALRRRQRMGRLEEEVQALRTLDAWTRKSNRVFYFFGLAWLVPIIAALTMPPERPGSTLLLSLTLFLAGGSCGAAWATARRPTRHAIGRSLMAGALGGALGAFLYLMPQWSVTEMTTLSGNGTLVSPLQLQLILGSIAAFAVGVGGDQAMERLQRRGDSEIGPSLDGAEPQAESPRG